MNRPTQSRTAGRLLALVLSAGVAACGVQDSDAAFSEIALPTFSKDRVAREAPVEVRRLHSAALWDLYAAAPSPDGRFITEINWNTGNLDVRELATGETRQVTHNPGEQDFWPFYSVYSPDGSRIAYAWALSEQGKPSVWEVRTIGVDGTDMKVHLSDHPQDYPEIEDWSKDGRYVLITMFPGGEFPAERSAQIMTLDVTSNETRVLRTVSGQGPVGSFFSPDGRYVAYDLPTAPDSRETDIFLMPSGGGEETTLIRTPDREELLGWFPDGSGILFHRSAEGSRAIWKLPVADGQPSGPPELVKDDIWNITNLGFTDDAFLYGLTVSRPGVHTARFDLEAGRVLGSLEPVGEPSGARTHSAAWSPDGRRLAYVEQNRLGSRLIVRSATGEILKDLPLALNAALVQTMWTAQGLLMSERARPPDDLYLVSPETGEVNFVTGAAGIAYGALAADDPSRVFLLADLVGDLRMIEYDLVTGTERLLFPEDARVQEGYFASPIQTRRFPLVSPDGEHVAVIHFGPGDTYLEVYSLSTGQSSGRTAFAQIVTASPNWSPDGRYLFFQARVEEDGDRQVFQYSLEDGSARPIVGIPAGMGRVINISVSPDGRRISLDAGAEKREVWQMTFNEGG